MSDPSIIRHVLVEGPSDYSKGAIERRVLLSAGLGTASLPSKTSNDARATTGGRKVTARLAPVMA